MRRGLAIKAETIRVITTKNEKPTNIRVVVKDKGTKRRDEKTFLGKVVVRFIS